MGGILFGMNWSRILLDLLILLLGTVAGLGAWAYAHRGYPDVVYYQRSFIAWASTGLPAQPTTVELWVDPSHERLVAHLAMGSRQGGDIVREGQDYFEGVFSTGVPASQPLTPRQSGNLALYCNELLAGGFSRVSAARLARAIGPATPVQIYGHPALRYTTGGEEDPVVDLPFAHQRTAVWIDARTYQPLQRQVSFADGTTVTERTILQQRIAPNTLPVEFFDPPTADQTLWDRALGWMQDRMARR